LTPSGLGSDETAYAIVRFLHGKLYLVAVGGFKDGFSEGTLQSLAAIAARHRVNYVIAERNYGGGMFNQLLKPYLAKNKAGSFDEEWDGWSSGQKELRILDTLEPLIQNHKLVVDRKVVESDLELQRENPRYSLVYQMTRISRQKGALANDDRIEAVSMACAYWVERMDRDEQKSHENHKQDLLDQELRKFQEDAFGVRPGGYRYHQTGIRSTH
jgi:hypothetical protein